MQPITAIAPDASGLHLLFGCQQDGHSKIVVYIQLSYKIAYLVVFVKSGMR